MEDNYGISVMDFHANVLIEERYEVLLAHEVCYNFLQSSRACRYLLARMHVSLRKSKTGLT